MRKIFLSIILSFTSLSILGQSTTNNDILQIYPPNAYALARYGDIPVDYSTGVPAISIPLMSISDKDVTVDLSLSYHARGIKVDQEASWVGLGWVLNAGGVITREVRGFEDKANQERPVIEDFIPDPLNYKKSLDNYLNSEIIKIQQISHPNEFSDGESDIYYYNFNGRSGKFFLDNNNNVCLSKYDDIKIEKNTFNITDDAGIKYIFGKTGSVSQGNKTYTTSYYLTKIIGPKGGEISFEYGNRGSGLSARRLYSVCVIDASTNTGNHSIDEKTNHAGDVIEEQVSEPLLTKIITKSGHYIDLTASPEKRKDTSNFSGEALKKILLYNSQNELQKGIELNYGYFQANNNRRYKDPRNQEVSRLDYLNYRLRLESVREFSGTNEYAYAYRFEYYGDNNPVTDDVYTLPYRLSPSQDHWGYYNYTYNKIIFPGNSNESYPYIEVDPWFDSFAGQPIYLESHIIYGANREPDAEAVKAGILNKIIYPTGGYTKFDFEANNDNGSLKGGLRIKQIETGDNSGNINKKKYSYECFNEDWIYINPLTNYYHSYYYNSIMYPEGCYNYIGVTHNFNRIRSALTIMGVPYDLVYNKGYNISSCSTLDGTPLRAIKVDGTSPLRLGLEGEASYEKVTEETDGYGKIEYHYTNCSNQYEGSWVEENNTYLRNNGLITATMGNLDDLWISKYYTSTGTNCFAFPYPSPIDYSWKNRLLTCKRVFSADGKIVSEDSTTYTTKALHIVPNFKVAVLTEYDFTYTRYYNVGGMVNITKEVNRQYAPDGTVVRTSKEYDYSSPYHKKPTETRTSLSEGGIVTEKYYYPTEYGNYFQTLTTKNILSPVDIRSYRNGKLVSGIQVQYNSNGSTLTKYKNEAMGTDIGFNPSNPFTFKPYLWNNYTTANLLESQKTNDDLTSIFLWGYNHQYPIAEIKNATFAEVEATVKSVFSVASVNELSALATPNETKLKDGSLQKALPNALVTTYTYKPLVGMLTSTGPTGVTTYYDYDSFGRLKRTYTKKSFTDEYIRTYDYHYYNQNQ